MRSITTLKEAFLHILSVTRCTEQRMTRLLPKMAQSSSNRDLALAFQSHLQETESHADRIEHIARQEGLHLYRTPCKALEGMALEGDDIMENVEKGPVRDVMLIACAQNIEHYEIAIYGTLIAVARKLGYHAAALLLEETLAEEKTINEILNNIALSNVNEEAVRLAA